jgi:hypothetical protein
MKARNWNAHPLAAVVASGGVEADLPEAETPESDGAAGEAGSDPLSGI